MCIKAACVADRDVEFYVCVCIDKCVCEIAECVWRVQLERKADREGSSIKM